VGTRYEGTPRITVGGTVIQGNVRVPAMHGPLALSVFWIGADSGAAPVEQASRLDSGVAQYSMTLFDAPPAGAAGFSALAGGGALALGVIALYADKDGDGALDLSTDLLLGASAQHLLVFSERGVSEDSAAFTLTGTLSPGYHALVHESESRCAFVRAAECAPEGSLREAKNQDAITLTLWPDAESVVVPAPAVARGPTPASIWTPVAQ
jgi:hypothetical protein